MGNNLSLSNWCNADGCMTNLQSHIRQAATQAFKWFREITDGVSLDDPDATDIHPNLLIILDKVAKAKLKKSLCCACWIEHVQLWFSRSFKELGMITRYAYTLYIHNSWVPMFMLSKLWWLEVWPWLWLYIVLPLEGLNDNPQRY